jgi:hypothetical protein
MAVPEVDILLAIVRRLRAGRSIFIGDGEHIYHRILRSGFTVNRVLLIIIGAAGSLGIFGILIAAQGNTKLLVVFSIIIPAIFSYMLYLFFQMEASRRDYFDQYLKNLFKEHLNPIDLVEVSSEDCLIVYSFSDFSEELLRLNDSQLERWLVEGVQFIKANHSDKSKIFMSSDGDLLVLDPKINGALRFHNFHQKFHDYMIASAHHKDFWPLMLLKYMPIVEVGRLPGSIEITITEETSTKVA